MPPEPSGRRDRGASVVELLVAVAVTGLVIGVVSSAVVVTLRASTLSRAQSESTIGEQRLQRLLGPDVVGATQIVTAPTAAPCGDECPTGDPAGSGVNLVQLTRLDDDGAVVAVSYRAVDVDADESLLDLRLVRSSCRSVTGGAPWDCDTTEVERLEVPACVTTVEAVRPDWALRVEMEPGGGSRAAALRVAVRDPLQYCDTAFVDAYADPTDSTFDRVTFSIARPATGTMLSPDTAPTDPGTPTKSCSGTLGVLVDRASNTSTTEARAAKAALVDMLAGTPIGVKAVGYASSADYAVALAPHVHDMLDPAAVSAARTFMSAFGSVSSNRAWGEAFDYVVKARPDGETSGAPSVAATGVDDVIVLAAGQPTNQGEFDRAVAAAAARRATGARIVGIGTSPNNPGMTDRSTRPGLTDQMLWSLLAQWVTGRADGTTFASSTGAGFASADVAALYVIDEGSSVASNWVIAEAAIRAEAAARCGGTVTVRVSGAGSAADAVDAVDAVDQNGRPHDLPTPDPAVAPRAAAFDVGVTGTDTITVRLEPRLGDLPTGATPVGVDGGWACRVDGVVTRFPVTPVGAGPWFAVDVAVDAASIVTCTLEVDVA